MRTLFVVPSPWVTGALLPQNAAQDADLAGAHLPPLPGADVTIGASSYRPLRA